MPQLPLITLPTSPPTCPTPGDDLVSLAVLVLDNASVASESEELRQCLDLWRRVQEGGGVGELGGLIAAGKPGMRAPARRAAAQAVISHGCGVLARTPSHLQRIKPTHTAMAPQLGGAGPSLAPLLLSA